MVKIKTTHVGSLPRSNELSSLLALKDNREKISIKKFDKVVRNNVLDVVKKQIDTGIDIVSDGEMSKISYATYIKDRVDGFSGESERRAPKDLDDFPSFKKKLILSGGTPTYQRPCCTSELKIKDNVSINKDIVNFKEALKKSSHSEGFMNSPSPGVICNFLPNKFYKNDDEYLEKLSDIMKFEYEKIIDSGLSLQIDCPDLALSRHMIYKDISEQDFLKRANKHVEVLNKSLENIDPSKVRMHICWGNYEGPHTHDIGLNKIIDIAFKANVSKYLIESANPRHAHEWEVFENIKLPKDKIIIPGVIESTSNFIEHPDVVKHRILAFSRVVDPDQLMAGTDCGFSTFAGFGNVDENIVYKKLESLVVGSELASKVI
jgi:5-methyltetrahydropteroyltriglutamate--homocysteine methyltransferase